MMACTCTFTLIHGLTDGKRGGDSVKLKMFFHKINVMILST